MTHVLHDAQPLTIVIRLEDQESDEIYQGELNLSEQQQQDIKALIGDGKAKVTVSREYSDKKYGNGGSVFVSVTLTCDQSQPTVQAAVQWGNYLADTYASQHVLELQQRFPQLGIGRD